LLVKLTNLKKLLEVPDFLKVLDFVNQVLYFFEVLDYQLILSSGFKTLEDKKNWKKY